MAAAQARRWAKKNKGRAKMKLFNIHNLMVIGALAISVIIWIYKPLESYPFIQLLLSLEGTILLAGAISSGGSTEGLGNNCWEKFEWAFIKPMKYSTTARFNPLRFYVGLFFLFVASIVASLK
jgi:hypothetical protein